MGHFYDEIPDDPKLIEWIKTQNIFHVASAPLNGELSYASHDVETDKTIDLYRRACERVTQRSTHFQACQQNVLLVPGPFWLWYAV
jgi:hypothetical protein